MDIILGVISLNKVGDISKSFQHHCILKTSIYKKGTLSGYIFLRIKYGLFLKFPISITGLSFSLDIFNNAHRFK